MYERAMSAFRLALVVAVLLGLVFRQYDVVWWLVVGGALVHLGISAAFRICRRNWNRRSGAAQRVSSERLRRGKRRQD